MSIVIFTRRNCPEKGGRSTAESAMAILGPKRPTILPATSWAAPSSGSPTMATPHPPTTGAFIGRFADPPPAGGGLRDQRHGQRFCPARKQRHRHTDSNVGPTMAGTMHRASGLTPSA